MLTRFFSVLTRVRQGLTGWEQAGKFVWPLAAADALGLAIWLFALNGFRFHRDLDQDDFTAVMLIPLLAHAACLQYRWRPGTKNWSWVLRAVAGEVLAAAATVGISAGLGLDLGTREWLALFACHLPLLLATRALYLLLRRRGAGAAQETLRLALVAALAFALFGTRYATSARVGSDDAYWYALMTGDFVTQWRAGVFPVFVGQSLYAFNGAINPLRLAPGLQHAAGVVDLLTGRALPFYALQNLTLTLIALAAGFSAYLCLAAILPRRRWAALALAAVFLSCPGILALAYQGDQFMSLAALPFVPPAVYGLWLTLRDERTSIGWTVWPLAGAWLCHPPIALWLSFAAALAHATIAFRRWRDPQLYLWWGRGLALFILGAGFLFVSVACLRLPRIPANPLVIAQSVRRAFPSMLLPLAADTDGSLGEYQLGWALWGLALAAAVRACVRPRRAEAVLLAAAAAMVLLLLPIPGLNLALWRLLPAFVSEITFYWPMQRFYAVLAAVAAVCAAGMMARAEEKGPPRRILGTLLLAAAVGWSLSESAKFVLRDYAVRGSFTPAPEHPFEFDANNLVLTRYSFTPFPVSPPYFSHGYIDPYLENRVLAPDRQRALASNRAAARPGDGAPIRLSAVYDGARIASLSPGLTLAPGRRYGVRVEPNPPPPGAGSLLAIGPAIRREILCPDPAQGVTLAAPRDEDFFSLWTIQEKPESVSLRYAYNERPAAVPVDFGRIYLQSYAIDTLPIKVRGWIPYQAEASAPADGAWLETPRLWISGYAATVNGRPAEVAPTPAGLVAVRLNAGPNDVVLRYPGSILLRLSYFASLATWLAGAVLGGKAGARRLVRRAA